MKRKKPSARALLRQPRIDLSDFGGQWVALNPRTRAVSGHGASLGEAHSSAVKGGVSEPLLYFVAETEAYFVGEGG